MSLKCGHTLVWSQSTEYFRVSATCQLASGYATMTHRTCCVNLLIGIPLIGNLTYRDPTHWVLSSRFSPDKFHLNQPQMAIDKALLVFEGLKAALFKSLSFSSDSRTCGCSKRLHRDPYHAKQTEPCAVGGRQLNRRETNFNRNLILIRLRSEFIKVSRPASSTRQLQVGLFTTRDLRLGSNDSTESESYNWEIILIPSAD